MTNYCLWEIRLDSDHLAFEVLNLFTPYWWHTPITLLLCWIFHPVSTLKPDPILLDKHENQIKIIKFNVITQSCLAHPFSCGRNLTKFWYPWMQKNRVILQEYQPLNKTVYKHWMHLLRCEHWTLNKFVWGSECSATNNTSIWNSLSRNKTWKNSGLAIDLRRVRLL